MWKIFPLLFKTKSALFMSAITNEARLHVRVDTHKIPNYDKHDT